MLLLLLPLCCWCCCDDDYYCSRCCCCYYCYFLRHDHTHDNDCFCFASTFLPPRPVPQPLQNNAAVAPTACEEFKKRTLLETAHTLPLLLDSIVRHRKSALVLELHASLPTFLKPDLSGPTGSAPAASSGGHRTPSTRTLWIGLLGMHGPL